MRRLIRLILLLTIAALFLAQPSQAQTNIQLSNIEINLWPEFDRPNMLVIYKVTIPADFIKESLTFRIPSTAQDSKPYKVASLSNDGLLYELPISSTVGSEWIAVTFVPDATQFQIEYYDTKLVKFGSSRNFEYTWPGDYGVDSAEIVIQLPVDATHMLFTPTSVTSFQGDGGLTYYDHRIGILRPGQTYTFSISYQKSTSTLTYEKIQVHPSTSLPQSMWNRSLPWALGVLAVVLIGGGVWVYWRSGMPQVGNKKRKRRKAAAGGETSDETGVYCHSCGRRASAGDVFCRSCGTKLRI